MQIINAIGRRKTSIARIYLQPGNGDISLAWLEVNPGYGSLSSTDGVDNLHVSEF
jgi:ribosomal protein S9